MSENIPARLDAGGLAALFAASPFMSTLHLEVLTMDYAKTELSVRMPLRPEFERRVGTKQFHGGALAALIDVTGDFALGMMLGGGVPTINLRVDYLKPAVGDGLTAIARVRRTGKTAAVVDIDVMDEKGSVVALGRGTYYPQRG
ncbi:MAG TPA: PaaI family thioesterase [Burkholderiales bacterium]|jgi:uncharacterized protein (TIGR00369 family)|nr:PaaI family thioesterase [Burkholderiales bacterium]